MTIMASGPPEAFERADPVLRAIATRVFRLGDAPGAGSRMKLVNQHLAGVHIAAAAEALVLAIGMGLDPHRVIETIRDCAGTSWMFENRGPHIADGDYAPLSAVDIFVKDLGIVLEEAGRQRPRPGARGPGARAVPPRRRRGLGARRRLRGGEGLRPGCRHRPARRGTGMILGAIGDDFTGSSDLALMLAKGGMRTVQYVGVPAEPADAGVQAGIVALKSRSVAAGRGGRARRSPRSTGCAPRAAGSSTSNTARPSNSTPQGNIGPVIDALIDALGTEAPVLVCPAFPAAGRTIYPGAPLRRRPAAVGVGDGAPPADPDDRSRPAPLAGAADAAADRPPAARGAQDRRPRGAARRGGGRAAGDRRRRRRGRRPAAAGGGLGRVRPADRRLRPRARAAAAARRHRRRGVLARRARPGAGALRLLLAGDPGAGGAAPRRRRRRPEARRRAHPRRRGRSGRGARLGRGAGRPAAGLFLGRSRGGRRAPRRPRAASAAPPASRPSSARWPLRRRRAAIPG